MSRLNQAFAALADPTRRGIVVHLARGEASVSDLVGLFSLTQPTISSHLKVLESAGLFSWRSVDDLRHCVGGRCEIKKGQDLVVVVEWSCERDYKQHQPVVVAL